MELPKKNQLGDEQVSAWHVEVAGTPADGTVRKAAEAGVFPWPGGTMVPVEKKSEVRLQFNNARGVLLCVAILGRLQPAGSGRGFSFFLRSVDREHSCAQHRGYQPHGLGAAQASRRAQCFLLRAFHGQCCGLLPCSTSALEVGRRAVRG